MLFGETQCIQVSFIEPITMWNTEIYVIQVRFIEPITVWNTEIYVFFRTVFKWFLSEIDFEKSTYSS